jgi:hypothetical protein
VPAGYKVVVPSNVTQDSVRQQLGSLGSFADGLLVAQITHNGQVVAAAEATRVRDPYLNGSTGEGFFTSYVRAFTGGAATTSSTVAGTRVLRATSFRGQKVDVIAWKQRPYVISFLAQRSSRAEVDRLVTYVMSHLKG